MAPKLSLRQRQLQSRLKKVEDNFIRSYGVKPSNKNKDDDYERNAKLLNELRDKAHKMGVPYRSNKEIVSASKEYREDKLKRGARAGYQEGVYNPKTKTRDYASPIDQTGNTYDMWDNRGGRKTILNNPVMDVADIAAILAGVGLGIKASIALAKNPSLIVTYPKRIQKKIQSAFSNFKGNKKMASGSKKAVIPTLTATVGKLVGSKLNQKTFEKFKNFPDDVKKKLGPKIKDGDFSGSGGASKMQKHVNSAEFQKNLANVNKNAIPKGPVSTVRPGYGPRVSNTSKVKNTKTSPDTKLVLGPVKNKMAYVTNQPKNPPKVNTGNFSKEAKPFISKRAAGSILTIGGIALIADNYGEKIANYWENFEFPVDKARRLKKEKQLNKLLTDAVGEQGMMGGMGEPDGGKPEKTTPSTTSKEPVNKKVVKEPPVDKKNNGNPVETYEPKVDKKVVKEKENNKSNPKKRINKQKSSIVKDSDRLGIKIARMLGDKRSDEQMVSDRIENEKLEDDMNFRRGGMPRSKAKPFGMGGMYKAPKKKYTAGLNMRYGGATKRSKGY